jgi:hypothetical protein
MKLQSEMPTDPHARPTARRSPRPAPSAVQPNRHPRRSLLTRGYLLLIVILQLPASASPLGSAGLLDDFATIAGWTSAASEGAVARLGKIEADGRRALALDFDVPSGYGYATARKALDLELPTDFQLSFDLQGETAPTTFEINLIDEHDNVWWYQRGAMHFPSDWTSQHLRRRHFSFAWGPQRTPQIRHVKAIEISVVGRGKGRILISDLRFVPADEQAARTAQARLAASSGTPRLLDSRGRVLEGWQVPTSAQPAWLSIDFGYPREIGGLLLDWAPGHQAAHYAVELSDNGRDWRRVAEVKAGNGGWDDLYLPEEDARWLRLVVPAGGAPRGTKLERLEVQGPEVGANENAFFTAMARREPRGLFPKYLYGEQSYWTVVGSPDDAKEALLAETGTIEPDEPAFSIEPFLFVDGRLLPWSDVSLSQRLDEGYLPIPTVEWTHGDLTLQVTAFTAGPGRPGSVLYMRYRITSENPVKGRLFLAVRPFQVNPPWQNLRRPGGWTPIEHLGLRDGVLHIGESILIPFDRPTGFGATPFESGDISEFLQRGELPSTTVADDRQGFASGALAYDFELQAGESRKVRLAVPFHRDAAPMLPNRPASQAKHTVEGALRATRRRWEGLLDRVQIQVPPSAQPVIDTLKSNLAYILINRDGPRIQPGSRNYARSWIRDGALTAAALLDLGHTEEARAFADWYAGFQFPNGKIPCVVDDRGADPTDEHDSTGEMIYLITQVYRYTHDEAWLRGKWPVVRKAVGYLDALRARRKTDTYRTGTPAQRALYGLVPESISHEGYSASPMHSYWDDFFTLRGLKDATSIADVLGEKEAQAEFAAERDDLIRDLYASIRLTMQNHGIDYIPGCAELGDLDPNATTIAIMPGNELCRLPQPALQRTFDHYFDHFLERRDGKGDWQDFTPYESRIIGAFVALGQKGRAEALLDDLMAYRRPAGWNQWAEVVFRDPKTPRMIGDMPHTWVGSDFIRSVRAMFVEEREQDDALVLAAGLPDAWILNPAGIEVRGLPTIFGRVDYRIRRLTDDTAHPRIRVEIGGDLAFPTGGVLLGPLLQRPMRAISGDGRPAHRRGEILVSRLPARIDVSY